jgi:pyruvate dehydrogenase kinase 2/3/4
MADAIQLPLHTHLRPLYTPRIAKKTSRATRERRLHADVVPAVQVIIADDPDNEDAVLRISDEGGGIPRSQIQNISSYLFIRPIQK